MNRLDNSEREPMTVSDALFSRLRRLGVRDVFMLSGGYIMYLVDSLGRAPGIRPWCCYHEQACAIGAEAYARVTGGVGVCLVTAGPGATNALSAIAGSWVESIPVLVISGQVRRDLIADYGRWRQMGPQEINIVDMARPVTKYVAEITNPLDVLPALDEAWLAATTGRPGPVWLSIPLDVQMAHLSTAGAVIDAPLVTAPPPPADGTSLERVSEALLQARRPVVVSGNGVHLAHAEQVFDELVRQLGIPVVSAIGGMDLLPEEHPCYFGRFGPTGQRRANFVLQNADLLLCLGTSLSVAAVGFNTSELAPEAQRVLVNVDSGEMTRPHLRTDIAVVADVGEFMRQMIAAAWDRPPEAWCEWFGICTRWKSEYPIVTDDYTRDSEHVNSYLLASRLSEWLREGDVMLTGNSLDAVSVFHSFSVKPGQRVMANTNFGAMGWDLPAAVGACVARPEQRVVLLTGDGSVLLNSQELLTLGSRRLNATVFVLNNGGYQSIRSTQETFCEGRLVGSDRQSGVANPDFQALATAYGLQYARIRRNAEIGESLSEIFAEDGPWLVEVNVSYDQERIPRLTSRRRGDGTLATTPLQDQYPFLPSEELLNVMAVSSSGQDDAGAGSTTTGER